MARATKASAATSAHKWGEQLVDVAGCRIQVRRAGRGEPLVILPDDIGVPGWLPFHERLAGQFELILISHPGFEGSDRPEWARNIRDLAAIESALMRKLGLSRPDVLAFGLGGWLASEIATQSGASFRRMILVSPFGLKPEEGEIYDQFLGRGPAYARAGFANLANFDATYGVEPDLDTLEGWEINREMTARVAWSPYLFSQALPHLLPLVESPVLIAWGVCDGIVPASESAHWARLLPRATIQLIEAAGHRVDIEQPDALAAAVCEFLAHSE